MRIEGVNPLAVKTAVGSEVGNGQSELGSRRGIGSIGVRLVGPIGELVGEAIVFSFLDAIEFFRSISIGPVVGGEQSALIIPAEAIGVAETLGEDFDLRMFG